jgi:hypothetical protein
MTVVELVNLALLKIGHSNGIATLADQSEAAVTASLVYDHTLRATLRAFPWPFATKYLALELTQGPATFTDPLVQAWSASATYLIGDVVEVADVIYYATAVSFNQTPPNASYWTTTATEEANGDWDYAYRWPVDCLFARRFVPASGSGRTFNPAPIEFRQGRDKNGPLLYTDEPAAVLEYTMIDCDALWADDLFIDAFTWRIAAALAPSLSRNGITVQQCYQAFTLTINQAATVASREAQLAPDGDAEHIRARD